MPKNNRDLKILALCILFPLTVGFLGSFGTSVSIQNWYQYLQKPPLTPPNWIFGPVWSLLYIVMGISLYFVKIAKTNKNKNIAYQIFGIQLFLNLVWSYLFFNFQKPSLALLEIVILWAAIFLTYLEFRKISQLASRLLIPYLLWVSFASYLNLMIVLLNK